MHMLLFCLFLSFSNALTYDINNLEVIKHQIVDNLFINIITVEKKNETLCQKHLNILSDPSQFSKTWIYRSKYFETEFFIMGYSFLIDLARIYYY